jgi:hypothetical protein
MRGYQSVKRLLINWTLPKPLKRGALLLAGWWILSVSLASCQKPEIQVTVCLVDPPSYGFQCSENGTKEYFLPLKDGKDLECMAPDDAEYFLKACKRGEVVEVTQCKWNLGNQFLCEDVMGERFPMYIDELNNYFCMSAQHRKRVIERCGK